MIIRQAEYNDINQIQKIADISWHDTYDGIIPITVQDRFLKEAYSEKTMKHRLKHSLMLVADCQGQLTGFANFSFVNRKGESELGAIYLLPEHQRKKAGSRLLEKGIRSLKSVKRIIVHVEKDNHKGLAFYQSKGFKETDVFEEQFYDYKLKTVKMALDI
ncbi:ribosomal protein S18 acetylase RimI-like enzyme [Scopulibacillus daqui]|uniref:Ribosomal protein S18 acetylase RimI-like enzyme n=1 Tax=Scopulibacillus daqui TaxID=1469162 RepID=A0ABS2Q1H0_9BACL|nr:GNAT family N-acetyltransferase [Scopulibacillus daqui]MBM7645544.1 ribosomal protein S18 acetylase RimI-like enzyme [Scopulibacillus daqui]